MESSGTWDKVYFIISLQDSGLNDYIFCVLLWIILPKEWRKRLVENYLTGINILHRMVPCVRQGDVL